MSAPHVHLKLAGGSLAPSDAQLQVDVNSLNAWPVLALEAAWESCGRLLADAQNVDILADVDRLVSAHGLKVKSTRSALRTLFWIIKGATKYSLTPAQLHDDLRALGLDDVHAAALCTAWEKVGPRLGQVIADRMVQSGSLLDTEWRFGVTVSTDDVARVGSTFLQLKLGIADTEGTATAGVRRGEGVRFEHLEMTIPQFYDLLAQLEKAQSYAAYLGQSG